MKAEARDLLLYLLKAGSEVLHSFARDGMQFTKVFACEAKAFTNDAIASVIKPAKTDSSSSEEEKYWQNLNHGDPMHIYSINDGDEHDHHHQTD